MTQNTAFEGVKSDLVQTLEMEKEVIRSSFKEYSFHFDPAEASAGYLAFTVRGLLFTLQVKFNVAGTLEVRTMCSMISNFSAKIVEGERCIEELDTSIDILRKFRNRIALWKKHSIFQRNEIAIKVDQDLFPGTLSFQSRVTFAYNGDKASLQVVLRQLYAWLV